MSLKKATENTPSRYVNKKKDLSDEDVKRMRLTPSYVKFLMSPKNYHQKNI